MRPTRGKLLLSVNSAWNVANFRGGLIRALQAEGWEVVAAAPADSHVGRVRALGCRFVDLPMDNGGTHPLRDLRLYIRYRALMRAERPQAFLGFTIKPNVWGSLAARAYGVPAINNIAGLGTAFVRRSWLTHVARMLYRHALRDSHRVLFQNEDDRRYFIDTGLVDERRTDRVPGSGVDLDAFAAAPMPPQDPGLPVRFLYVGRILRDKGILEYVEAARRLGPGVEFALLGPTDAATPGALSQAELDRFVNEGVVRHLGVTDDVRPHIAAAHCIVLPSFYREGVPRSLIEAAAMGRPLITTDTAGCREVVDHGVNGYLVRARDAGDLAAHCARFAALAPEARARMGAASRLKAEREFDERRVFEKYFDALRALPAQEAARTVCSPGANGP